MLVRVVLLMGGVLLMVDGDCGVVHLRDNFV